MSFYTQARHLKGSEETVTEITKIDMSLTKHSSLWVAGERWSGPGWNKGKMYM